MCATLKGSLNMDQNIVLLGTKAESHFCPAIQVDRRGLDTDWKKGMFDFGVLDIVFLFLLERRFCLFSGWGGGGHFQVY